MPVVWNHNGDGRPLASEAEIKSTKTCVPIMGFPDEAQLTKQNSKQSAVGSRSSQGNARERRGTAAERLPQSLP